MSDIKAYIIVSESIGEGLDGPWAPQECSFRIAADQVFLKKETAHIRAKELCERDALENEGTTEIREQDFGEVKEKVYAVVYPENSGFFDWTEYYVMEMELCDVTKDGASP